MITPVVFTFLAHDAFLPQELGWMTAQGVIRPPSLRASFVVPNGSIPVRALDAVQPGHHGRFVGVAANADVH
jgi:hypothetical protein